MATGTASPPSPHEKVEKPIPQNTQPSFSSVTLSTNSYGNLAFKRLGNKIELQPSTLVGTHKIHLPTVDCKDSPAFVPISSVQDPATMSNGNKPQEACYPSHSSTLISYADMVRGKSDSGTLKEPDVPIIELTTLPSTFQGKPAVLFPLMAKQLLVKRLKFVLVGKFSHGRPSLRSVKLFFVKLQLIGDINITVYDNKHIFLECSCKEDFYRIWLGLTWFIEGLAMRVFKWFPDFSPLKESSIAPVWTNVAGLPLYMFEQSSLMSIAKAAGSPIRVDSRNINRSIVNTAWICIELDVQKQLVEDVWVSFVDENGKDQLDGFWIKFSYQVVPPFCSFCQHIGHTSDFCKRKTAAMDFKEVVQIDLTVGYNLAMESVEKAPLSRSLSLEQVQVEEEGNAPDGGMPAAEEAVAGHAFAGAVMVADPVVEAAADYCADPAAEAGEDPAVEEVVPAAETGAEPARKAAAGHANTGRRGMAEDCRENTAEHTSPTSWADQTATATAGQNPAGMEFDAESVTTGLEPAAGERESHTTAAAVGSPRQACPAAELLTREPEIHKEHGADFAAVEESQGPSVFCSRKTEHQRAAGWAEEGAATEKSAGVVGEQSDAVGKQSAGEGNLLFQIEAIKEEPTVLVVSHEDGMAAKDQKESLQQVYDISDSAADLVIQNSQVVIAGKKGNRAGIWADLVDEEHEQQLARDHNAILEWDAAQVRAFVHNQIEEMKQEIDQTEPKIRDADKEEKQLARELKFVRARKNLKEYFMASAEKINSDLERKRSEKKEKTTGISFKYGD